MKGFGEGVAFAGLCVAIAWIEVSGKPAGGLWAVVVIWALMSDWGKK